MTFYFYISIVLALMTCDAEKIITKTNMKFENQKDSTQIITGSERIALYLPKLEGKKVALVVNQTSLIGQSHLTDTLLKMGINIQVVFAPEHGFRGEADAGEYIKDDKDAKTGLPVLSLYGKKKKPSNEDLKGVELVIFDIQDVGVRFYTYISTLHNIMESCAENNLPLIILDRPNPNAHYTDGPILDPKFKSFVGMHPVPIVYGMTIGEYAQMINGEGWLENKAQCNLTVIPCKNYNHNTFYELPVRPSPNLPDIRSILVYPSTCFFEGTNLSLGRGTNYPFQWIGHPKLKSDFSFTPQPNVGAKEPPLNGKKCYGIDLSQLTLGSLYDAKTIELSYVLDMYHQMKAVNEEYFLKSNFFDKLAGTDALRNQIIQGMSANDIKATWQKGLKDFELVRTKYLIY